LRSDDILNRAVFMQCKCLRCGFFVLSMLVSPSAFTTTVILEGPDELTRWMMPYLPEDSPAPKRLQAMLEEMLATEGYFSPSFTVSEAEGIRRVRFDPGPRTHVAEATVDIDGPIDAERKRALLAAWRLPAGRPFRQQDWSEAKQQVLSDLLAVAHADARLVDSAAEIDAKTRQARLMARYDAGPPYRFGGLDVTGLYRYPASLVARYNRSVVPGEPYREEDLAALQSALAATPYFASARIALDRGSAIPGEDGALIAPVKVDVQERAAHRLGFGAGVSSNTGARVEAGYHTPNLFKQTWNLDGGLRLEQKQQTAYADVVLPPDDKNRRHAFGLMVEASDIQGLRTLRHAVGVQTIQPRGSVEQRLSLNWERERQRPDGEDERIDQALAVNALWIWRRVDNPLDPRRGVVLQGEIGGGSRALFSDQDFVRLHVRWLHYVPLGESDSLAVRVEAGATLAPSRKGIPQNYLFRAGGTGSVRGYAYRSLGVEEGSATVGGRYLAVSSVEATHWLSSAWGVAAFVDAGDAADRPGDLDLAVGYGLGVRWKSPAGPIGVDLAYGQRNGGLHVHFALAIPF
jgi:translocation and assembly module TamA